MEGLKQRYSELEKQYIDLKEEYDYAGEQFENRVNRAANTKAMMKAYEKDQEIQRLQEQLNQLTPQKTEMEIEEPKARPERIEIEEKKEGEEKTIPPPTQNMQTRSQGPPSFGEQIHQEVYDPLGNLTWKGSVYKIPNMGEYGAYDVVVNLIHKATGDNKKFKNNFVNYAQEVEGDKRAFDNNGYIKRR